MNVIDRIKEQIKNDPMNKSYTNQNIDPIFVADSRAKILIVGQAPGRIAEQTKLTWNDKSGDNLRSWLGVDRDTFYDKTKFALIPMDFYFPGKGKQGDLPPRKGFAEKWHPLLLKELPNIELIVLVGSYAQNYYLGEKRKETLTETVRAYQEYLPKLFPLIHPSPRNIGWHINNPWFKEDVLPKLKQLVHQILNPM
jgi:uracil-DNA glycosylase